MQLQRRSFLKLLGGTAVATGYWPGIVALPVRPSVYYLRFIHANTGNPEGVAFEIGEEWFKGPILVANVRGFSINWHDPAATLHGFAVYNNPRCRLMDMKAMGPFNGGAISVINGDTIIIGRPDNDRIHTPSGSPQIQG